MPTFADFRRFSPARVGGIACLDDLKRIVVQRAQIVAREPVQVLLELDFGCVVVGVDGDFPILVVEIGHKVPEVWLEILAVAIAQ